MLSLLTVSPAWFSFAVLFFLCIGILPLMRRYFEGFPYNIAVSSAYGDVALLICVMIGIDVLKRRGVPEFLLKSQDLLITLSFAVGIINSAVAGGPERNTVADSYHNLVIVALFVYFVPLTALPIVWVHGTLFERWSLVLFGFVWVLTLVYDFRTGRLQQPKWLREHGKVTHV